jgi:uncharacterized protein (DUF736 family)
MEEKTQNEWAAREIGALWKKEGQNQKYLSGKLKLPESLGGGECGVVVFTNRHKNQDNHPDFRVYLDSKSVSTDEETAKVDSTEQVAEGIL